MRPQGLKTGVEIKSGPISSAANSRPFQAVHCKMQQHSLQGGSTSRKTQATADPRGMRMQQIVQHQAASLLYRNNKMSHLQREDTIRQVQQAEVSEMKDRVDKALAVKELGLLNLLTLKPHNYGRLLSRTPLNSLRGHQV